MSHSITLAEAVAMTTLYRENREKILAAPFQNKNVLPLSETFDKKAIETLLAQPGCTQLRIYYGLDNALELHAVLVAADAANADILPATNAKDEEASDETYILEQAIRCPPSCPSSSPLNEP